MKKYDVLTPGDWPAEFYIRQAVYSSLYPSGKAKPKDGNPVADVDHDHNHYTTHIPHSISHATETLWTEEMQSVIPLMGPLHILLNVRKDICDIYHPFMKFSTNSYFQDAN